MKRDPSASGPALRPAQLGLAMVVAALALFPEISRADETGVSFWLPGQFGSLAAVPQTPGWSLGAVYYHTTVRAAGSVAAAKEIQIFRFPATVNVNLNANLNAQADLMLLAPTYTFATPVLGGQLAVGVTGLFGNTSTTIGGTLTTAVGPFTATRMGSISDALTSVGDLYPMVTLRWNNGVHNYMAYATGDIPVGAYDSMRLSNLGLGHGAIDSGGGYTYFNRRRVTNFPVLQGSPTISRIQIRNIRAALIFTSIGAHRNFSRNSSSSASSDMCINRSLTILVNAPSWVVFSHALSESALRSGTCSRWETCRDT
jgi:hypothetical protein